VPDRTPRIAVYRDHVLPLTQTFVAAQTDCLPRDATLVVGGTRVAGGPPLATPSWVVADAARTTPGRTAAMASLKVLRRSGVLERRLQAFGAEVVLAHFAQDGYRVLPAARRLGIPLAVVCHGSDVLVRDEEARHGHWGERRLAGRWPELIAGADLFLAVSQHVGAALADRGVPPGKILVHYIGVHVPDLDVDHELAQRRDRHEILFVGRLARNKGAHHLLEALARWGTARLRSARPVRATIVGDGEERPALEAMARKLGLGEQVQFAGALPHEQVLALMRRARVLCAPSVAVASGAGEGLSMVALEAQARAVPVVAFATGGLPEAVGAGGLLGPPGDVGWLAFALDRLTRDHDLWERRARAGRARTVSEFDVRRQTTRLVATLRRLADTGDPDRTEKGMASCR